MNEHDIKRWRVEYVEWTFDLLGRRHFGHFDVLKHVAVRRQYPPRFHVDRSDRSIFETELSRSNPGAWRLGTSNGLNRMTQPFSHNKNGRSKSKLKTHSHLEAVHVRDSLSMKSSASHMRGIGEKVHTMD